MRRRFVSNVLLREIIATGAAVAVSSIPFVFTVFPNWLSRSSPPDTPGSLANGLLVALAFSGLIRSFWLLPGCNLIRQAMEIREARGYGIAVKVAAVWSLFVVAALIPVMRGWPPSQADWIRRLLPATEAILFVMTWLMVWEYLTPSESERLPAGSRPGTGRRAVVVAMILTGFLGFLGGAFMDFGGDGDYRLQASVLSPDGQTRADIVDRLTIGGGLGHVRREVYLNTASEEWSKQHRGLLIWRGRYVTVDSVTWESDHALRVEVRPYGGVTPPEDRVQAYDREGFKARTLIGPAS